MTPVEQFAKMLWGPPTQRHAIDQRTDGGLYQVYGHHVVFGPNALLYVGMADNFAVRFAQHEAWLTFESDVQIRLGQIVEPKCQSPTEVRSWLSHIEALTIYWHSPPYNSKSIVSYGPGRPPLRVQNHGDRGRLLPEYSSHWVSPRPTGEE